MSIFLETIVALLKNREKHITLTLIAEETNLTKDWLESLLYKSIDKIDPSIKRLETLYNYLSDEPFSISEKENDA